MITPLPGATDLKPGSATRPFFGVQPLLVDEKGNELTLANTGNLTAHDIQISLPTVLVGLIMLAVLGSGVDKVIIALVIVQWAYYARLIRSSALVEQEKDYISAARCLAMPAWRIQLRELLPNCLPPLMVVVPVHLASAITLEATLSFLGVGVPITEPSLGALISQGFPYLLSGDYWISVFPGLTLFITIASINLVGDQLRDALNPRLSD